MTNRYSIKLSLSLLLFLVTLLTSCSENMNELESISQEKEFTFQSHLEISTPRQVITRSSETKELESLRLLVFDEDNRFLYSRVAVLGGFDPVAQKFSYSVKLISSTRKRSVHFVANHDWDGFEQDYFLEGLEAGYIIGRMAAKECVYWSLVELDELNAETLSRSNTKLMSNQALISAESSAQEFQLEGFKIYNTYDRGTVASFEVDERGRVNFRKDLNTILPTVPSDYELRVNDDFQLTASKAFERSAVNGHPLFVLIKGTHNGKKNCYYKVDLKKFDPQTGVTQLYDILRNHAYNIRITRVVGLGYETEEEAAKAPASNNIFASIELENYNGITNGTHELVVDKLRQTLVSHPYTFETDVQYTQGLNNIRYYPSWGKNDPYLEALDESELSKGIIRVKTKQIPSDRTIIRTIDIVASSDGQGKDIITRQVKLILEQPYKFYAYYKEENNGDIAVHFTLSKKLDDSVYPLDIFIEAKKLTPIPSKNGSNMVLVYQNGSYAYKFTFRECPKEEEQVLYFKKNNPDDNNLGNIRLNCFYFLDDDATVF